MKANDGVIGTLLVALAIWVFWYTARFPDFPGQRYGPDLVPRIIAAGFAICGGLLILRGIAQRRAGLPWIEWQAWVRDPARAASAGLLVAALLLYVAASEQVGFIPIAAAILLGLFFWLRVRAVVAIPTALATVFVVHWFFATLLRVPLPRGILDPFI